MAAMEIKNGQFVLPVNVTAAGTKTQQLATEGTYVDKNIKIEVNVPDGALEAKTVGAITATPSIGENVYTTDTETKYPITIKADAAVGATQIGVKTEGFVDSSDTVDIEAANAATASKTVYIKAGSLKGTGSASAEGGNGVELGAESTTVPTSGYYIKASAAGGASVDTAGWVDATTPAISVNGDSYYAIDGATLANNATAGKTYTEQDGPVLVSGDYLYINKGYIEDTKISLADLVPDGSNVKEGENSNLIYNTVSVYDNDGTLIAGTMGDAEYTLASGALNITNTEKGAAEFAEDGSKVTLNMNVTGNATISSTVGTEGYLKTTDGKTQTANYTGTASAAYDVITVGVDVGDTTNLELTPNVAKDTSSSAAFGAVTTTAPTSGHYAAFTVSADSKTAFVSPKVTGEGYGSADHFKATSEVLNLSLANNGIHYIPITEGTCELDAGGTPSLVEPTAVVTSAITASTGTVNVLTTAPTSGDYITIAADATTTNGTLSATTKCTMTEGYITSGTKSFGITEGITVGKTAAQNKYIKIYDGTIYENIAN